MQTEKEIFDKLSDGKKPPVAVLIQISKPVMADICIQPKYVTHFTKQPTPNEIMVYEGNTKELKRVGITEEYSGHSGVARRKGKTRHEVYINTDRKVETQLLTLAHETGHHVIKDATGAMSGNKKAEERAKAVENGFAEAFNKRYKKYGVELATKKDGAIKPSINERNILRDNIKPQFAKKGCKLSRGLKL